MKTYKQFLNEVADQPSKDCIVLAFGRMQPPTIGHAKLLDTAKKLANEHKCRYEIWLSPTHDAKKNPLQPSKKVLWARKILKDSNIFVDETYINTPIRLVKTKNSQYKNIIFVAGSDRVAQYQQMFDSTNGKSFQFDSIQVVSAGERDPDADETSGMSATKLRNAAIERDFDTFKRGVKNLTDPEIHALIKEIRDGLKIKDVKESISGVSLLRNRFYLNEIFRIGQFCQDAAGKYEILDRGANYVTVSNQDGELHKRFIENLHLCEDATIPQHIANAGFSFKGFVPGSAFQANEQAVSAFASTVEKYNDGKIEDAVAILKALKAVDAFLTLTHSIIVHSRHTDDEATNKEMLMHFHAAKASLSRIGEFYHHMDYLDSLKDLVGVAEMGAQSIAEEVKNIKSADRLKVASIIADTLGVETIGSNPEGIVNAALRKAKQKPMMLKGEAMNILQRMLELAKSVDINYDETILKDLIKPKSINEGASVAVNHDSGKVTYGRVKGMHGSVVEVSHRNGKVGFYHQHRVEKLEEKHPLEDLGADQHMDPTPTEPHTAPGHSLQFSNHSHRKMKIKDLADL